MVVRILDSNNRILKNTLSKLKSHLFDNKLAFKHTYITSQYPFLSNEFYCHDYKIYAIQTTFLIIMIVCYRLHCFHEFIVVRNFYNRSKLAKMKMKMKIFRI